MTRRLLLLITDLQRGGTPTVVRELAIHLSTFDSALHVEVACLAGPGPVVDELRATGITVTPLGARRATDLRVISRLHTLLRDRHIDTVVSFLVHANVVAAAAAVMYRDVRWLQSVQTTQPWPRWHWLAQRVAAAAAESIAVPSHSVADSAVNWSGIAREKIVVIPNAIDENDFTDIQSASMSDHPFKAIFLGRLDPVKDVPTLVDAIARLNGMATLDIYGDGADRPRVESTIATFSAGKWVSLKGAATKPADALRGSAVLVLPSLAEGFGLVLIEAMAAGVPVVATDVAGIRDVVSHERTGLLVPPARADLLADALCRLAEDAALRQRLIVAARREVHDRFTWNAVLPHYARWLGLM